MDISVHWKQIQQVFQNAGLSSLHFAVATVDKDANPWVTPIGSIILRGATGMVIS